MEIFHGVPVWHASVATAGRVKLPVRSWDRRQRQSAERLLRSMLAGVGRRGGEHEWVSTDGDDAKSLQVRRLATPQEEAMVGGTRDVRCQHGRGLVVPR